MNFKLYWKIEDTMLVLVHWLYSQKRVLGFACNVRSQLLKNSDPLAGKMPNRFNGYVVSILNKFIWLEDTLKELQATRDRGASSVFHLKRFLRYAPVYISYPICLLMLRFKGKVCFELSRSTHGVKYATFKRVEGGWDIHTTNGIFEIPRPFKMKGLKWYRWIKNQILLTNIRDGQITRILEMHKAAGDKKWTYHNRTKHCVTYCTKPLFLKLYGNILGIKLERDNTLTSYERSQGVYEIIKSLHYPWVSPSQHALNMPNSFKFFKAKNAADVLQRFGIKPSKSLVKALNYNRYLITGDIEDVPDDLDFLGENPNMRGWIGLNMASIIWYITRDVNLTRKALVSQQDPNHWFVVLENNKRVYKYIYKKWNCNKRKFCEFLGYNDAADVVRMLKRLMKHEEVNVNDLDWRSYRSLHDSCSRAEMQIRNEREWAKRNEEFEYSKSYEKLHNKKLSNGLHLVLPVNGHMLNDWGNWLNCCVGGYYRDVNSGRCKILGIFNNDKLVYVFEVRKKEIVQIRGKHNHRITKEHYSCFKEELDWPIIDREKPDTRFPRPNIDANDFFELEAEEDRVEAARAVEQNGLCNEVPF